MLDFLKKLFGLKSTDDRHPLDAVTTPNVSAPYKVPEPAVTTPIPHIPEPELGYDMSKSHVFENKAATPKAIPKPKAAKPKAPVKPKATAEKAPAKPKAPKKPKISIAK